MNRYALYAVMLFSVLATSIRRANAEPSAPTNPIEVRTTVDTSTKIQVEVIASIMPKTVQWSCRIDPASAVGDSITIELKDVAAVSDALAETAGKPDEPYNKTIGDYSVANSETKTGRFIAIGHKPADSMLRRAMTMDVKSAAVIAEQMKKAIQIQQWLDARLQPLRRD